MTDQIPAGAQEAVNAYLSTHKKSIGGALLFAVLLGPVGALYGSAILGSVLTICTAAAMLGSLPAQVASTLAGICWLIAIVMAPLAAHDHTNRVTTEAALRLWHGCMR